MSLACESKLTLHYIAHPASAHVSKSKIRRHLKSEVRTVPDYSRCPKPAPVPLVARPGQPGTAGFCTGKHALKSAPPVEAAQAPAGGAA